MHAMSLDVPRESSHASCSWMDLEWQKVGSRRGGCVKPHGDGSFFKTIETPKKSFFHLIYLIMDHV
jgi:hypothetical protein